MIELSYKEAAREALGISREQLDQELADLEEELVEAERKVREAEDEVYGIEEDIRRVKKEREARGSTTCPRCKLKQEREPEIQALCCVLCGYCELEREGFGDACEYHGEYHASEARREAV
jgi:chromosome segregation ATPase